MSEWKVVETVYGKYSKYEIVKHPGVLGFGKPTFHIRKNGKYHKGSYSTLKAAVEAAEKDGH